MKNEKQTLLSLNHLEVLLNTSRKDLRLIAEKAHLHYTPFDSHKKGKPKWRHIDNPHWELKRIQKNINKYILKKESLLLPSEMTGGITGRSIIHNASYHIGKECIGIIDINNCFPNISHERVYEVWREMFGCGARIASLLTKLTTLEGRLPQGAPSSSLLCNFVLLPVFLKIKNFASKNNLNISIFVDDIIISGSKKDVTRSIQGIISILLKDRLPISRKKISVRTSGFQQKGTGIIVNKKISVGRQKINEVRSFILEIAKTKDFNSAADITKINGEVTFAKQVSLAQGRKLELFARKLLVAPIVNTIDKKVIERRACNNFNRNHNFFKNNSR